MDTISSIPHIPTEEVQNYFVSITFFYEVQYQEITRNYLYLKKIQIHQSRILISKVVILGNLKVFEHFNQGVTLQIQSRRKPYFSVYYTSFKREYFTAFVS